MDTPQTAVWQGDFGRNYTDRNTLDSQSLDELWRRNYGVSRTETSQQFLGQIPKHAAFLEVGCNTGNQLLLLKQMGWSNLSGLELQPTPLKLPAGGCQRSRSNWARHCRFSGQMWCSPVAC